MQSANGKVLLAANGEIYRIQRSDICTNEEQHLPPSPSGSRSTADCGHILQLWEEYGRENPVLMLNSLRGEFAFVLHDVEHGLLLAARDPYGVKPLFVAETRAGQPDRGTEVYPYPP